MNEGGRILSQDEIDGMLKAAPQKRPAAQAAPPPSPPAPAAEAAPGPAPPTVAPQAASGPAPSDPAPSVPPAPATMATADGDAMVADLAQRLATVEEAVGRLGQLEKALAEVKAAGGPRAQDFQAVVKQLKKVSAQVEGISKGVQATPGFGAHNTFKCGSCGTGGLVAAVFRCTRCGKDRWLGWWPQK